jgi:hypothetical protein
MKFNTASDPSDSAVGRRNHGEHGLHEAAHGRHHLRSRRKPQRRGEWANFALFFGVIVDALQVAAGSIGEKVPSRVQQP